MKFVNDYRLYGRSCLILKAITYINRVINWRYVTNVLFLISLLIYFLHIAHMENHRTKIRGYVSLIKTDCY